MLLNIIHLNEFMFEPESEQCMVARKRKGALLKEIIEQGIEPNWWDGVILTDAKPKESISAAHRLIVGMAKALALEYICIAEDDVRFTAPGAWEHYLTNMPAEFDLYLGGVSGGQILPDRTVENFSGLFCYTIHKRFYDAFLAADPTKHIDRELGKYNNEALYERLGRKPVFLVCDPMVAITQDGWSYNKGEVRNHAKHWKPYELFK